MLKDSLKKIREDHGLTKRELCEKTGISERAYLTYEFGEREPKISVIQKLADFYHVSTDYLLGREETKNDPFAILNLGDRDRAIVEYYISLSPKERTDFVSLVKQIAQGAKVKIVVENPSEPEPQKTFTVRTAARSNDGAPITNEIMTEKAYEELRNSPDVDPDL